MKKFDAGRLFINITGLSNMGHAIRAGQTMFSTPHENIVDVRNNVSFVCEQLGDLELTSSLASANELSSILHNEVEIKSAEEMRTLLGSPMPELSHSAQWALFNQHVYGRYRHYVRDLVNRFKDELSARMVISVSTRNAKYLVDLPLFGDDVFDAFPAADDDITEAGKCIAMERPTAAVFHLMRAMEEAVKVLGQKLNATVADTNGQILPWGIIVANIKPKIDALQKGAGQDDWLAMHALLHSVNRAFRTKTAHPIQKYSTNDAENAFNATKAFMQEMAERAKNP